MIENMYKVFIVAFSAIWWIVFIMAIGATMRRLGV